MKPKILVLANQKRENYKNAIIAAGGEPTVKYLPDMDTNFDGLLLCGGNDISPSFYGQEILGAHDFDAMRDTLEIELTRKFIDTGKPILGICRGLQLLNVTLGGTLIQDLPSANFHRAQSGLDSSHNISAEGILKELYGDKLSVNSAHHQGIDILGNGLRATAICDGVIEAVEHSTKPYFAVQFHPERMCLDNMRGDTVDGLDIFKYFIELCKTRSM